MTDQALLQLQQAAQNHDGFAITLLGQVMIDRFRTDEAIGQGIKLIDHAALDKNVLWAKCLRLYMAKTDAPRLPIADYALVDNDAITQLQLYAEEENMWAQAVLGNLLHQSKATIQNREEAARLLCRSVDNGCQWAKELVSHYCISNTRWMATQIHRRITDRDSRRYWLK